MLTNVSLLHFQIHLSNIDPGILSWIRHFWCLPGSVKDCDNDMKGYEYGEVRGPWWSDSYGFIRLWDQPAMIVLTF